MEELIQKVIEYADNAHGSQMRKYEPARYIVHPIRVMKICQRVTNDVCILAAAILHDVLEDTPVEEAEMKEFLRTLFAGKEAERITRLVVELTDVYTKKDYPRENRRSRKRMEHERMLTTSADAQTIKYADIIDNSVEIAEHDPDFAKVFLFELKNNLDSMDKGNRELYNEAVETVNTAIAALKRK